MPQKLLAGHISVYAFDPAAQLDWKVLDASQFNAAIAAGYGWDISCAIEDSGYTLGTTGYDTSNSKSICDFANSETPTFKNYEASLDGFRSDPADPTAVYDLFYSLFSGHGREFYLVERIGPAQGTPIAAGQIMSAYGFDSDYGLDVVSDNDPLLWGARFAANGNINTNVTVVA